jgi:hypothetical protein
VSGLFVTADVSIIAPAGKKKSLSTEENFLSFFEITLGTTVFDTQKEDLNRFELD